MIRTWLLTFRTLLLVLVAGLVAAVNGCDGWSIEESIPAAETLRVVALKEPLSRLRANEGWEHDLLWHFAQNRNSKISWKWVDSSAQALELLRSGQADIAAGRWSAEGFNRNSRVLVGPAYEEARAVLICHRDLRSSYESSFLQTWFEKPSKTNEKIEDRRISVALNFRDDIPGVRSELQSNWKIVPTKKSSLALAYQIERKRLHCFVTDKATALWIQDLRPQVRIVRELGFRFSKAFLFSPNRRDLEIGFTSWFQLQNRKGEISFIRHRYFGYQKSLSDLDRQRLFRARETDLPDLRGRFVRYGQEFRLPWALVASVAYQESHWNNGARSHTGVRGIMQLTRDTAKHLGVEDREDLEQSLWGGAKYLRYLIDKQPTSLHPRERLALALASYNVGFGHLRDAQKLAVENGRRPFSFWDLRLILPLLSDPAIANDLEFGQARGEEPVQFTERVLAYYDILSDRPDVH